MSAAQTESERDYVLEKVISGGQTGADQEGLYAARAWRIPTGGYAPAGMLTSDGFSPQLLKEYGLEEMPVCRSVPQAYVLRSKKNVDVADATIAIRTRPSPGTDKTIVYCLFGAWPRDLTSIYSSNHDMFQHGALSTDGLDTAKPHRPCLVIIPSRKDAVEKVIEFIRSVKPRTLNICGHRCDNPTDRLFAMTIRNMFLAALRPFAH